MINLNCKNNKVNKNNKSKSKMIKVMNNRLFSLSHQRKNMIISKLVKNVEKVAPKYFRLICTINNKNFI